MEKHFEKLKESFLDIIFPRFCISCGREGRYICNECDLFLTEADNDLEGAVSIWEYEGLIKKAILKVKEGNRHIADELVERAFAIILRDEERFENFFNFLNQEDLCLTYVPMSKEKEKQKGFNHSEVITEGFSRLSGKRVIGLLEKNKENHLQSELTPAERRSNVRGMFSWAGRKKFENVVLVDDIYATGFTMEECVRILKDNGVKNILKFTLVRQFQI